MVARRPMASEGESRGGGELEHVAPAGFGDDISGKGLLDYYKIK